MHQFAVSSSGKSLKSVWNPHPTAFKKDSSIPAVLLSVTFWEKHEVKEEPQRRLVIGQSFSIDFGVTLSKKYRFGQVWNTLLTKDQSQKTIV
ncbi:hypothetical protein [Maridesulfovibrio sp.]|uniref:hypothetical protein n=1 Tax=Maridesulfovibrio sp. TaxID=2795000 RepID=UPI003BAB1DDE